MNSADPRNPWSRLIAAARSVRDEGEASAPYGFSTRVVALAFAGERRGASLLERVALRAVGVACLLAVFSVVLNYSALAPVAAPSTWTSEEMILPVDDAIAVVLEMGETK